MTRCGEPDEQPPEELGGTADDAGASAEAIRAYAQMAGLQLGPDPDEELLAETIELLEAMRLLTEDDLGRVGMAVDFSPDL